MTTAPCTYWSTALAGLNAETSLDGVEDLVGHSAVLVHHAQGLGIHFLSNLTVLQGLGVDEHVQGCSLQCSLAANSAAACVRNSQAAALGSKNSDVHKAKKGYRKRQGHRQPYTKLTIEKINA